MAGEAWLTVGAAVIGYLIKASQDWWLATGKVKADRETVLKLGTTSVRNAAMISKDRRFWTFKMWQ